MLNPWSILIVRPKGAAIRGHATKAAIIGPSIRGGTSMTGPIGGSSRVTPFGFKAALPTSRGGQYL